MRNMLEIEHGRFLLNFGNSIFVNLFFNWYDKISDRRRFEIRNVKISVASVKSRIHVLSKRTF